MLLVNLLEELLPFVTSSCRDEVNRLMEILNSKVTDLPNIELQKENAILTARKDDKGLLVEHGLQKLSNEQTRGAREACSVAKCSVL